MTSSLPARLVMGLSLACGIAELGAQERAAGLSPVQTSRLAELLDRDWKDRPEWAEMAIGILHGDSMGSGGGWYTGSQRRHDWAWLESKFASATADGRITRDEIKWEEKSFDRLDRNNDDVITADDFEFSKNPVMEDESSATRIFSQLDDDSNGRLTQDELQRWFKRAAGESDFLSVDEIKGALGLNPRPARPDRKPGTRRDPRWEMLGMLINGELGSLEQGPNLNEEAPEINLALVTKNADGSGLVPTDRIIKLADSRGSKPVVLIFGSFT